MRNAFNHAVFVGRVLDESEAAIVSSRLRSREEPESGIDLSNGFGGFILRVCSDGGSYEAFIRTELYETEGIEYVCKFTTETKMQLNGEKSRNKFTTVRLAFERFQPVMRGSTSANKKGRGSDAIKNVPQFRGSDIRYLGFRFSAQDAATPAIDSAFFFKGDKDNEYRQFYLAFDYIKVYARNRNLSLCISVMRVFRE
ncbi:NmrA-like family [Fragilaria crotonensis]|nr:NmrA-like family [Fragilaria crotonensis]